MRLILTGCEYSGTTTLGNVISDWALNALGSRGGFHDHWKIPHISGHPPHETAVTMPTEDEKKQVLAASPRVKELLMRYALYYHTPTGRDASSGMLVGYHIEDMIYGPLYFGYGGDGEPGDRRLVSQDIEQRILLYAPHAVLILVKASADVIGRRMREAPHQYGVVPEKDIEHVLDRFDEEFQLSQIHNKLTVDTSSATVDETLAELLKKVEPHLSDADRMRLVALRFSQKG
jgi:hypothetical protein